MEDKILKILASAKLIEPTQEFKERGGRLIFETSKKANVFSVLGKELRENFRFGIALTLASFLLFAILGGKIPLNSILGNKSTAFNSEDLIREVETLNFQIQLGEAKYFNESAEEIAALLGELKNSDSEIDNLLNEIIF